MQKVREDFLHFIWKYRRFNAENLQTSTGEPLEIIHMGMHNHHAGPDFENARIKINGTIWAGQVEIHVSASEWFKHKHQDDRAYDNVILHVVLEEDVRIKMRNDTLLPTLVLKDRIMPGLVGKYLEIQHAKLKIPCQKLLHLSDELSRNLCIDRTLIHRIERKTAHIEAILDRNKNNWQESFYQMLARGYGSKLNAEAFEVLARITPLNLIARHHDSLLQIEALLYGQSGLLDDTFKDEYPNRLKTEYAYLQKLYKLRPMMHSVWKFARLRPASFPTLRISQLATLLYRSQGLLGLVLDIQRYEDLATLIITESSSYWRTRYNFDTLAEKPTPASPGDDWFHHQVINTIVPFLFVYGRRTGHDRYERMAIDWLEQIPAEDNTILDFWRSQGFGIKHAGESQALIELYNEFCQKQKCLSCVIGASILK